jgi:hypothetical protein
LKSSQNPSLSQEPEIFQMDGYQYLITTLMQVLPLHKSSLIDFSVVVSSDL